MSMSYALILGIPAAVFAYIAFKLDDRHAVMRMMLVSWSWIMMLPLPVVGMELAKDAGLTGVQKIMEISLIPLIFGFIFWSFYLIMLYLKDSTKAVNRENHEFSNEFD